MTPCFGIESRNHIYRKGEIKGSLEQPKCKRYGDWRPFTQRPPLFWKRCFYILTSANIPFPYYPTKNWQFSNINACNDCTHPKVRSIIIFSKFQFIWRYPLTISRTPEGGRVVRPPPPPKIGFFFSFSDYEFCLSKLNPGVLKNEIKIILST